MRRAETSPYSHSYSQVKIRRMDERSLRIARAADKHLEIERAVAHLLGILGPSGKDAGRSKGRPTRNRRANHAQYFSAGWGSQLLMLPQVRSWILRLR